MEKKKRCKQKIPGWMATFADMVTLLLVFFVMLLASGEVKKIKTFIILSSFEGQLGIMKGGQSLDDGQFENLGMSVESLPSSKKQNSLNKAVKEAVTKMIQVREVDRYIRIEEKERGVVISLLTDLLFEPGRADINLISAGELIENLRLVVDTFSDGRYSILFEGHADDYPIRDSRFKDQWDLSMQRSWNVLEAIRRVPSVKEFNEDVVSIKGFGNSRPIEKGGSPEVRMYNRRVDIVITQNKF